MYYKHSSIHFKGVCEFMILYGFFFSTAKLFKMNENHVNVRTKKYKIHFSLVFFKDCSPESRDNNK